MTLSDLIWSLVLFLAGESGYLRSVGCNLLAMETLLVLAVSLCPREGAMFALEGFGSLLGARIELGRMEGCEARRWKLVVASQ